MWWYRPAVESCDQKSFSSIQEKIHIINDNYNDHLFLAAGEPLCPHFQFPTKAKNKDKMKIECEMLENMKCIKGQFGFVTQREWGCTYSLNDRGGMNYDEFKEYCLTNLSRLFPDVADTDALE